MTAATVETGGQVVLTLEERRWLRQDVLHNLEELTRNGAEWRYPPAGDPLQTGVGMIGFLAGLLNRIGWHEEATLHPKPTSFGWSKADALALRYCQFCREADARHNEDEEDYASEMREGAEQLGRWIKEGGGC